MKYNKLVRDKIPNQIKKKGEYVKYHVATDQEYWDKLKEKLLEEFKEFITDESIEEYADLLEVIEAIGKYKEFDRSEVKIIKDNKIRERGSFDDRIILEES